MYKGASQSLVRRTAVDRPHPSRGYVNGGPDPLDVLPSAAHMTLQQALAERDQLRIEFARVVQDLTVSKSLNRSEAVAHLGQKHQAIQTRLAAVKARISELSPTPSFDILADVVRDLASPELARQIFTRYRDRAAREALKG